MAIISVSGERASRPLCSSGQLFPEVLIKTGMLGFQMPSRMPSRSDIQKNRQDCLITYASDFLNSDQDRSFAIFGNSTLESD